MADDGRSCWKDLKEKMKLPEVKLGRHTAYWMKNSPRRFLHSMSYYKFAAKMIGQGKTVLDVGCGEGLGTWLLAKECGNAEGIDFDAEAIDTATANWETEENIKFTHGDILERPSGVFDAAVSFDVIEHVPPENASAFLAKICENLKKDGILVLGTPSEASQKFASEIARAGHVNIYNAERLEKELSVFFKHVMIFCANDEIIHTGFPHLAHYFVALACRRRAL